VKFGATGQKIYIGAGHLDITALSIDGAGSAPTTLFQPQTMGVSRFRCSASDLSGKSWTNLFSFSATPSVGVFVFAQCKFPSGWNTITGTRPNSDGSVELYILDCHSGDTHSQFEYHNSLGSLVSDTGVYYTTGAAAQSWKITTQSTVTVHNPFYTPWVPFYNTSTSSTTPRFEILRSGAAGGEDDSVAYDDDEVWAEFQAKVSTGSTKSTLYTDKMATNGTPAAQATGDGLASWSGEGAQAWSGKCDSGTSFTPAEVGDISGRIGVGLASIAGTLYVDPEIRAS
jgi:hypothetical protein